MIASTAVYLVALSLTALTTPADVTFTAPDSAVSCYDFLEVVVNVSPPTSQDPFTQVPVGGTFGRDGEGPIRVEGFCDSADGSLYRIRFMPAEVGRYHYSVCYRDGAIETTHEGSFEARRTERRGLVRIDSESPWHFRWEGTGEPYFWLGNSATWLAGGDDTAIAETIGRLYQSKFSNVRVALCGGVASQGATDGETPAVESVSRSGGSPYPWVVDVADGVAAPHFDKTRFDTRYWQRFERMLRQAREKDMIVSVAFLVKDAHGGIDPFGKEGAGGEDEQRYYRYAVARLGAFSNVIWILADEYPSLRTGEWVEKMGAFLKACDPYDHLTSVVCAGDFPFRSSSWVDFALTRGSDDKGGWELIQTSRDAQLKAGRTLPQVREECAVANPTSEGADRDASLWAGGRRRLAWEIYLAGGWQITAEGADRGADRGAEGGTDPAVSSEADVGEIGEDAEDASADATVPQPHSVVYDFFTSIPFRKLRAGGDLIVTAELAATPTPSSATAGAVRAARSDEGDLAVIYLPRGGVVTVKSGLLRPDVKPMWFNPRDGTIERVHATAPNTYETPDGGDWVLLFRTGCNCSLGIYEEASGY
ncbi:MAG: DUF5060 domain-containing protein [Planctomycetota bacterium]